MFFSTKTVFSLLLCLSLYAIAIAEPAEKSAGDIIASRTYMSKSEQSLDTLDIIDAIDDFMSTNNYPGYQICIAKDDRILWSGAFGLRAMLDPAPMTEEAICVMGSVSKTVVGVALMQLWERGLLDLDSSVNKYIPIEVVNPNFQEIDITLRMLMSHYASFNDYSPKLPEYTFGSDSPVSLAEFMEGYFEFGGEYYSSLNYNGWAPGSTREYCDAGVNFGAYLVEQLTGEDFNEYCKDSIFIPLGMTETSYMLADFDSSQLAEAYYWSSAYNYYIVIPHWGHPFYPVGYLKTNANQLMRYLLAIKNGGEYDGVRILENATVDTMLTVQYPEIPSGVFPWMTSEWGLVWWNCDLDGRNLWGHEGLTLGFRTLMYICPEENSGMISIALGQVPTNPSNSIMLPIADLALDFALQQDDDDGDGLYTLYDNCPHYYNPDQTDSDDDGFGDICDYICGDVDGSEEVNILDIVFLIDYKFKNGQTPAFFQSADVNSDA